MISYIKKGVREDMPKLPISDEQFEAAKSASEVLTAAFSLEKIYNVLLDNYVELEQELLSAAVTYTVRNQREYEDFFKLETVVNRRVINFLATAHLYLDQAPQRLKICTEDGAAATLAFKARTKMHRDTSPAYGFLRFLRNHALHYDSAVHTMYINSKWLGSEDDRKMEFSVFPWAEKQFLADDPKLKGSTVGMTEKQLKKFNETKNTIEETLKKMPEKIVLTQAIREYLQCMGDIHSLVRSLVEKKTIDARSTIQQHISTYAAMNNGDARYLEACRTDAKETDAKEQVERIPLFLEWDDVRLKLVTRNTTLTRLADRVVSNEVRENKQEKQAHSRNRDVNIPSA